MLKRRRAYRVKRGALPSEEIARAAVEAACAITKADPENVLSGQNGGGIMFPMKSRAYQRIARARTYAAFALRAIFEDGSQVEISRMVGSGTPKFFMGVKDHAMRNGELGWWSDTAFMTVIEKTEAFMAMEKKEVVG